MKRLFIHFALSTVFLISSYGNSFAGGSGKVRVDGSSTVFPITEAVAEEFQKLHRKVRVTVGISGTGGGFKKFATGQIDINDASRPIKKSEKQKAKENGIDFIELPVAYDGLSVVVNPNNDFVDYLTVTELRMIWQPGSTVKNWNDVRPEWPKQPIKLYGPGADSGTFDYFTKAINGKSQASRADFTASEDDNVLVMGVAGDPYALGYFGYAYYRENQSKLKLVPVDGGDGAIKPSEQTINDGSYKPLSRPIFIYVSKPGSQRPEVKEFVQFYLKNAALLSKEVGYIPLPDKEYQLSLDRFKKWSTLFLGKKLSGLSITKVLFKGNQAVEK
ncbi:MAG: PstS family phosphate ABC transporter substrate-binding protein [Nitrospina sp.]|jgi:phosphate transport system substrate-binding protein|nr:PstS family phosphate ABC transporter substrate-binding protein [Nitrospina sp.]MBT6718708.1 PstS family phosphate ABC transporter substrate-binding protein [Nitrospina sp.]